MAGVKYQVERRPIGPSGKVYRGQQPGDYISVLTDPENLTNFTTASILGGDMQPASTGGGSAPPKVISHAKYVPVGVKAPSLATGTNPNVALAVSHVIEQIGEPWLVHSTHFSVESATEGAATLANAIGAENVRIVKVITGALEFKI